METVLRPRQNFAVHYIHRSGSASERVIRCRCAEMARIVFFGLMRREVGASFDERDYRIVSVEVQS